MTTADQRGVHAIAGRAGGRPATVPTSAQRGVQFAVAAYLMWGLLTIYWKQLSAFGAAELIAWRMMLAAIVMAVLVTVRRAWPAIVAAFGRPRTLARLAIAALLLTGNWGSYVWSVTNDRVIETALGYFLAPLVTMGIGVVVFHETPNRAQRTAAVCAVIAVIILTVSYGRPPWVALILAGSWGGYGLAKRQIPLGAIDSLAGELFVLFIPSTAFTILVSGHAGSVVDSADTRQWLFVLGTGVITVVPLILFAAAAQSSIPFTLLGPLNLLVPVINFGLGWLLYDEPMPPDRLIGFAFVWAGLIVIMTGQLAGAHRARRAIPAPQQR